VYAVAYAFVENSKKEANECATFLEISMVIINHLNTLEFLKAKQSKEIEGRTESYKDERRF